MISKSKIDANCQKLGKYGDHESVEIRLAEYPARITVRHKEEHWLSHYRMLDWFF